MEEFPVQVLKQRKFIDWNSLNFVFQVDFLPKPSSQAKHWFPVGNSNSNSNLNYWSELWISMRLTWFWVNGFPGTDFDYTEPGIEDLPL